MIEKHILKELNRNNIGTYAERIHRLALFNPDEEAFVYGNERVTFSGFNRRVNGLIHSLISMGMSKGDVLGLVSWNCMECNDVNGAAMKGGYIIAPINPRLQIDELEYLINYSEAKILFVGPELIEKVNELRPRLKKVQHFVSLESSEQGMISYKELIKNQQDIEPDVTVKEDDPFIIFFTSGTTGQPRGALYTHDRKLDEARTKVVQIGVEQGDRHIMVLPMFHIGGWSHYWTFFYSGACNVIMTQRAFDPESTVKIIQEEKATDIHIVPTQLVAMLTMSGFDKNALSSLKRIWYAASPMPTEVLKKGMELFGPIFMQGYGQSESGPDITFMSKKEHLVLDKPAEEQGILSSCGRPCENIQVRIVDGEDADLGPFESGEIIVRSRRVMKEYWHMPDKTSETIIDGWLHTGDIGYYDNKGYIYIVDRKKDMIITGGENVYPREAEEVLYRNPAVQEVAVIGIPDPYWVERVHAVIVLKEGSEATEKEIISFCKEHLAGYKSPKSVEFVSALPKNPQGKILKRELKAKYKSNS